MIESKSYLYRMKSVGGSAGTGRVILERLPRWEATLWYVRAYAGRPQPYSVLSKTAVQAALFNGSTPMTSPSDNTLVARLRGRADWYDDAHPGTVKTPELLRQAATALEASYAENERLRKLVEQAFRDGLTYGTNVEGADPDIAWEQSRVRALKDSPK